MSEPPSSLGRLSYLQGGSGRRLATVKEGGKKMLDIDGEIMHGYKKCSDVLNDKKEMYVFMID